MARIKDVAARAQVSVATVSRVINHNPRVKAALRARVMQAIAELDYQPSGIARNMRSQSAPVVGLIISDIQNPFFTALVRGVEDVARQHQYSILLCNSDEDPRKERLYLEVLNREKVAGIILVPAGSENCARFASLPMPVVLVDRKLPCLDTDTVVINNFAGAYQAVEHLIDLGHRRIGLISASAQVSVSLERQQGYVQALRDNGLPIDERLIARGDFKEDGGYKAAWQLLLLKPPPTALFAINNLMTLGALRAIQNGGLRIPKDISMIGFDDMPWLPLLQPPLTAVRQPTYEIGREAAALMFRRLEGGARYQDRPAHYVVLEPELIVRGSTAAPAF